MENEKKINNQKLIFKIILISLFLIIYIKRFTPSLNIEIISDSKYHSINNKSSNERIFLCIPYIIMKQKWSISIFGDYMIMLINL